MSICAFRSLGARVGQRAYASAVAHGHHDVGHHGSGGKALHPLYNDHPVAPVATYDMIPIPVVPYKEGFDKQQASFNKTLAISVVAFVATGFYIWKEDVLSLRLTSPPKWYTHRKVGKGLGDI